MRDVRWFLRLEDDRAELVSLQYPENGHDSQWSPCRWRNESGGLLT